MRTRRLFRQLHGGVVVVVLAVLVVDVHETPLHVLERLDLVLEPMPASWLSRSWVDSCITTSISTRYLAPKW